MSRLDFGQNTFAPGSLADDIGATVDATGRGLDILLPLQRADPLPACSCWPALLAGRGPAVWRPFPPG
jgi:hypothetical protein